MSRETEIAGFMARHGFGSARTETLAQDASLRRYLRLRGGPHPAVLMDAPPPEDLGPFLRVGEHLAGLGLSVPEIYAIDEAAGLLLLEDLGDALFPRAMACESRPALFDAAVDVLVVMQEASPPPDLPAWGAEAMAATAEATLLDWWWPARFGQPAPADARQDFAAALRTMLAPLQAAAGVFVHRDYFAGNLIWMRDRRGLQRVGILDFQSASMGHPAYDLASLIQDARRDIPPALAERATARLLAHRPSLDPGSFRAALAICAAQRHVRVAGQWVRLARREGRPQYLAYGPRTWRLLEAALAHPAAASLAAAFARWIRPERRGNPPDLSGNAA
jgi:N-acetylmuramate 1-kinase